jgi:hypothetical protein
MTPFTAGGPSDCSPSWEWLRRKAEQKSQRARSIPKETGIRKDLDSFLAEPIILPSSTPGNATVSSQAVDTCQSSLHWWLQHRSNYHSLVPVVRMLFGVPATSVPSERLLSKAGLVINDRRSRITPQHAEQQCFLSCNWLD